MRTTGMKDDTVLGRVGDQMTRSQVLRLKTLADEAYQPGQYATNLTFDEAARRIDALKAEIALADSF